jgi:phosphonate transport system substrate-binding protein
MSSLLLTSLQAPLADPFCRRLTAYLAERLGQPVVFADDDLWQERQRRLDSGEVDVAWICGLPYVRRTDTISPTVSLVAAPVMSAPRYGDSPIYFSDVVVRQESEWTAFADLRGKRWAYNEPSSHSGHGITRFELARSGLGSRFFSEAVEAGSHQSALELVLQGDADATALDSTVLEALYAQRPELHEELRVIATWGPSPIPPWVASSELAEETRLEVRTIMTSMHMDDVGREILAEAQTARFCTVENADYDPIREMARMARGILL